MEQLVLNSLAALCALIAAVVEASLFYAVTDLGMGFTITWPLVLAVGFCAQIAWQLNFSEDLEERL